MLKKSEWAPICELDNSASAPGVERSSGAVTIDESETARGDLGNFKRLRKGDGSEAAVFEEATKGSHRGKVEKERC